MAVATTTEAIDMAGPFVADDLDSMPDDGNRREVIDGALIVTPAPARIHQRCLIRLAMILAAACPDHLEVLLSPLDWRPSSSTDGYQPDLVVLPCELTGLDTPGPLRTPPLLAVEAISPSSRVLDQVVKRQRYEANKLPAYWIVDVDEPSVLALRLDERGCYVEAARARGEERFATDHPFSVELRPVDLIR
jgi:Uma2 family endonuclease